MSMHLRRAVLPRALAHRSIDWAALTSKATTDSSRAAVNQLRAKHGEISALASTYAEPPPPIDFEAYKAKISSKDIVAKFEEEYSKINIDEATYAQYMQLMHPEDTSDKEAKAAEVAASVEESKGKIAELSKLVALMESKMTGPTTTLEDLYEVYPDLQAEIEDEIENHEWSKDIA